MGLGMGLVFWGKKYAKVEHVLLENLPWGVQAVSGDWH